MRKLSIVVALASACYGRPSSPIVGAARSGDLQSIRTLAARGADPNEPDGVNEWTPLEHAVHKHQGGSVTALLDAGADPNRADPSGTTPLMMAAGYGYTDIVQLLLRRGADPRLRDHDGATALDFAVSGTSDIDRFTLFDCQNETVHVLRDAGASAGKPDILAKLKRC